MNEIIHQASQTFEDYLGFQGQKQFEDSARVLRGLEERLNQLQQQKE
ncbi:MAG: hypothetical protein JXL67_05060 [Calditrichaeota bacterium]|nr:hypothetical protein [Calditrichota bacterium]